MKNILILHGPNLNLLGQREPDIYGHETLVQLNKQLHDTAGRLRMTLLIHQSNSEEQLINHIHQAPKNNIQFILFNPAAFSHTSIALRDALLAVSIPFIEVHISNVFKRESFRHFSYFSDIAKGVISGLGTNGYQLALQAIHHEFTQHESKKQWIFEKSEN